MTNGTKVEVKVGLKTHRGVVDMVDGSTVTVLLAKLVVIADVAEVTVLA